MGELAELQRREDLYAEVVHRLGGPQGRQCSAEFPHRGSGASVYCSACTSEVKADIKREQDLLALENAVAAREADLKDSEAVWSDLETTASSAHLGAETRCAASWRRHVPTDCMRSGGSLFLPDYVEPSSSA